MVTVSRIFQAFRGLAFGGILVGGMIGATPSSVVAEPAKAAPFFAGVWQLETATGVQPLVLSDWLMFDGKLPQTWLYTRQATPSSYAFYTRNIGVGGYQAVMQVSQVDEKTMNVSMVAKKQVLLKGTAKRLSIPLAKGSCLAVETNLKKMFGKWVTPQKGDNRTLVLKEKSMVWLGKSSEITIQKVRDGQWGLSYGGQPLALMTDAGGDYAVLQWLRDGEKGFSYGPGRPILKFKEETILRKVGGRCDAAIKARLKLMKKGS